VEEYDALKVEIEALKAEVGAQPNADVARPASIVQTLTDEIARLRAPSAGQVVEMGKQSNR
jgi:uncharacterized small protein (DUF1192 family)